MFQCIIDEYGKPSLDFITSFSTFTVGNSLCTHPALLNGNNSSDAIPTVELYYHLKVPIFPYANGSTALNSMHGFQQNGNQYALPGSTHHAPFINDPLQMQFPYLGTPVNQPPHGFTLANNLATHHQAMYPLNTALGGNAPQLSPGTLIPSDNFTGPTTKRAAEFDGASPMQSKKLRSSSPSNSQINYNEMSFLMGSDTLMMLDGFTKSPIAKSKIQEDSKDLFSASSEIRGQMTAQPDDKFASTDNHHAQPEVTHNGDQPMMMMGTDTMALFDEMESSVLQAETQRNVLPFTEKAKIVENTNETIVQKISVDIGEALGNGAVVPISSSSSPLPFTLNENGESMMSMLQSFMMSPEKSQSRFRMRAIQNTANPKALFASDDKPDNVSTDAIKPVSTIGTITNSGKILPCGTSNSVPREHGDVAKQDEGERRAKLHICAKDRSGRDGPSNKLRSPTSTGHDTTSPRFSHISIMSADKRPQGVQLKAAVDENSEENMRRCENPPSHFFQEKKSALAVVNTAGTENGNDRFSSHSRKEGEHTERVQTSPDVSVELSSVPNESEKVNCDGNLGGDSNVKVCSNNDRNITIVVDASDSDAQAAMSHDSVSTIRDTGSRDSDSMSHEIEQQDRHDTSSNKVNLKRLTTVRSCGIPTGVMRRNNRKPHLKRINPTFVAMLSRPPSGELNIVQFGYPCT